MSTIVTSRRFQNITVALGDFSNIEELTTADLLKLFNAYAECLEMPLVKKFASRAKGLERVCRVVEQAELSWGLAVAEKTTSETEVSMIALVEMALKSRNGLKVDTFAKAVHKSPKNVRNAIDAIRRSGKKVVALGNSTFCMK